MKFWQAMKALEDGQHVRRKDWKDNGKIYKASEKIFYENDIGRGNWFPTLNDFFSEWEIYEEPRLTFSQVVKGLKDGKKFRRKSWNFEECYIHAHRDTGEIIFSEANRLGMHSPFNFCLQDLEADDWIQL
jgi:hypothetical protein